MNERQGGGRNNSLLQQGGKTLNRKERTSQRHQSLAKNSSNSNSKRSFFDTMGQDEGNDNNSFDANAILSAKSRFASEFEAEEYARSRNKVIALEREEETKTRAQEKKKSKQQPNGGGIEKEWHCRNCGRAHSVRPVMCYRANHDVRIRRKIKEAASTGERRQALSDSKAEDGGLKLGMGLEWSRWNGR